MFEFKGKVALVTGGSSGIGVLFSHALAARGCDIVLLARRKEKLEENAENIRNQYGVKCLPLSCDVTDSARVRECKDAVWEEFHRCDILINCAGVGHNDWALELTDEKWLATMDVCLNGVFYCAREFASLMKENYYGRVINISSMLGGIALDRTFGRGICEYSAAKGGVINLTRQLANEWAPYGITVNCLSPGFFASEQSPVGQEWFDDFIHTWCPMKRPGKNHELDAAIVFMASEEASYMTGQNLIIDGGWSCT